MQGASVKQTRSVCSERARTPVRICEAKTRILRVMFQPKTDAMFIESQLASPSINGFPQTAENRTLRRARA